MHWKWRDRMGQDSSLQASGLTEAMQTPALWEPWKQSRGTVRPYFLGQQRNCFYRKKQAKLKLPIKQRNGVWLTFCSSTLAQGRSHKHTAQSHIIFAVSVQRREEKEKGETGSGDIAATRPADILPTCTQLKHSLRRKVNTEMNHTYCTSNPKHLAFEEWLLNHPLLIVVPLP